MKRVSGRMLPKFFVSALVTYLSATMAFAATKIGSVDFKNGTDSSTLTIKGDGPITFEKTDNAQDKQTVIELKGANFTKSALRKLDMSSFASRVSLVSPYNVDGQPDTARVVIQFKDLASVDIKQDGNNLVVTIPEAGKGPAPAADGGDAAAATDAPPAPGADGAADPAQANAGADKAADAGKPADAPAKSADAASPKGGAEDMKLDQVIEHHNTKRFTGKPISLQLRDVEVVEVLRLIGETSGFNMVISDDVKGKMTLSLIDVPWDQALDVVLQSQNLGAERNNNILRVMPLTSLTKEKQAELDAKRAAESSAPRLTRVFPISYAKLDDLKDILSKFGTTAQSGTQLQGAATTSVIADSRTNSIIVQDTAETIDRMQKLIEILDTQTPQVLIQAKIVEVTEKFAKSVNGSLGIGGLGNNQVFTSFNGANPFGNPIDPLIGNPGIFPDGNTAASNFKNSGAIAISPTMGFIPGLDRLNAILQMGESEDAVKVLATPKTVVLNRESAAILETTPAQVAQTFTTQSGPGTTFTVQDANLGLEVSPTITNEGGILMTLAVARDQPNAIGIAKRQLKTRVLVESGNTLAIGGVYVSTHEHTSAGFPILRKIPILGALFGSDSDTDDRSELMFFITPQILNAKEAGVSG